PHLFAGSVAAVLAGGSFDRVLGSLHALAWEGQLVNSSWLFKVLAPAEVMRRYLAEVVALVEGSGAFEILAHLDYPRRHWPASAGPYSEADFEEEYRAVLRALASSGRVLEGNTYSPLASVTPLGWWRGAGGVAGAGRGGRCPAAGRRAGRRGWGTRSARGWGSRTRRASGAAGMRSISGGADRVPGGGPGQSRKVTGFRAGRSPPGSRGRVRR